ncbi:MFS transporter [Actinophytocola gossypii]|uniref:MFS transporter n=1 Tax=Actinophytocola gossypii TaxID=2812003 RepID=A0ABT2J4Q9_9PSEU|nr:MFS transporter [Actinophytocola gossypii]MCT2582846.1 MFS transporter [Actinophytocola gossypii]
MFTERGQTMGRAGFRDVLSVREFRALWGAELLSVLGDQFARVGIAVLVYARTSSASLTALTYALTFLPAILGGVLLGGLADRYRRRELMVAVDVLRAVLAALMAIPALPLPVLMALVFPLTLVGPPFKAAQQALLPAILTGDRYVTGLALRTVTNQTVQAVGFLFGGVLVALVEPHVALGLNAATFLLSAVLLMAGVRDRPAARRDRAERSTGAARLVWRDRRLRGLTALSWLIGVFVVPEGLAAPYAAGLGVPVAAVGLLMAAMPVGNIVGAWLVARVPDHRRARATTVLAVAAGVPLALCAFGPPLWLVVPLWALCGACATGYLLLAQAAFVLAVPDHHRGAASGLVGAGVLSSQGLAILGAGILADMTSSALAVAVGGVAGIVLTGLVGSSWLRARIRPGGRETDDADQHGAITSPSFATSDTPPSRTNGNGHTPGFTNPSSATSGTPPTSGNAVENDLVNGNGHRGHGLTSPSSASDAPPSGTNGNGHTPGFTSPSSATSGTPPTSENTIENDSANGQLPDLTSPSSASDTPPPSTNGNGRVRGFTSPSYATSLAPPSIGTAAEHGMGDADQREVPRPPHPASPPTDTRSRGPARWALWREPARVLALLLVVETAAAGLTLFHALRASVDGTDLAMLGIIVGLGVAMGEMTRHVERVRRRFNDTPHVNLTSVWTFSAILVLPTALVPVVTCALYLHLFWRSWYRVRSVRAYRLVFTASTVVLAAHSASAIRYQLAPGDLTDWGRPEVFAAIVLAVLVYSAVNLGLVATAITLHEQRLSLRRALGTGKEAALEYGTIGLGAINAILLALHPSWSLMMVPALLVLHRSVLLRQLEEAASTDQKTGLANATAWTNLATAEVRRAARDETRVGVLMVDLDHFKAVNDLHGHLVGDRVLQAVADTLTACAGRYDVVGRWGGEEFVVLCPEITREELHATGERICERVRELRVPVSAEDGAEVVDGLSVSIGVALYPEFGPDLQDVLLAADDALFVAKDSGRNQVQAIVAAIGDLTQRPG